MNDNDIGIDLHMLRMLRLWVRNGYVFNATLCFGGANDGGKRR